MLLAPKGLNTERLENWFYFGLMTGGKIESSSGLSTLLFASSLTVIGFVLTGGSLIFRTFLFELVKSISSGG